MTSTLLLHLLACTGPGNPELDTSSTAADPSRPWRRELPPLSTEATAPRGYTWQRAIVHLHSSWSHDACDGEPLDEAGQPRRDCLEDLRRGLCEAGIEHAFLSDHPAHFATAEWGEEALLADSSSTLLPSPTDARVLSYACSTAHTMRWYPGVEDELMPVALDRHVDGDAAQRDQTYNQYDGEALEAFTAAGAVRLLAHTESRDLAELQALVAQGLQGVEFYNLHASFDPGIRSEHLGLDPVSWLSDLGLFMEEGSTAEPDLFVLSVLQRQEVSEQAWDALNASAPGSTVVFATAGTDAHQNVLPTLMSDGERVDSYRRMLRWFSQHLWVDGDAESQGVDAAEQALAAGRFHVVFEILGTPVGFDLHLRASDGAVYEMGSAVPASALPATLVVGCPSLAPDSPRGERDPEVLVSVLRDGIEVAQGCGEHTVSVSGTWRVEVDMIPWHIAPFLGDDAETAERWMRAYPWITSNPIRVLSP